MIFKEKKVILRQSVAMCPFCNQKVIGHKSWTHCGHVAAIDKGVVYFSRPLPLFQSLTVADVARSS